MQSKIMRHTKKGENRTHGQEKKQPKEVDPEMIQLLESSGKEFRITTKKYVKGSSGRHGHEWMKNFRRIEIIFLII